MKPMLSLSRALRTLLTLSVAVSLATACAATTPTPAASTDGGSTATDGGNGTADGGVGSDSGNTGTDTASTGTDSGGGGTQAKLMTVKEVLDMAHKAQAKVKTCPPFVNPPEGQKVAVKNLIAVTPVYTADKAKTLDGVYAQLKGGGPFSGLRLAGDKASKLLAGLKVGERFDIEGQVLIFYCEVQIKVTKITKSADAAVLPQSTTVTLADVGEAATPEKNNSYEAALVKLNNVVVGKAEALGTDDKAHGEFWLAKSKNEKGLIVKTDFKFPTTFYTYDKNTKSWTTKLVDGQKLTSITGILTYSFSHWKLVPLADEMLVWDTSK